MRDSKSVSMGSALLNESVRPDGGKPPDRSMRKVGGETFTLFLFAAGDKRYLIFEGEHFLNFGAKA